MGAASAHSYPVLSAEPGAPVMYRGRPCRIERIESFDSVVVQDEVSEELIIASPHDLRVRISGRDGEDAECAVTESEIDIAIKRTTLLLPYVLNDQAVSHEDLENLEKKLDLGRSQIYLAIAKLRVSPCPMAIARKRRGPKKGSTKLSPEVEDVVAAQIKAASASHSTLDIHTIWENVDLACDKIGKTGPCERTVHARIASTKHELLRRKKLGKRRAHERTTPMPGTLKTTSALALVEIDHSPLDIFLVSSATRSLIGRAYVTVVLDTHTRAVLGFHLSLEAPSSLSVALALVHAMSPKEAWLAERGLSNIKWPMYGLIKGLRLDDGADFHARALSTGCKRWGMAPPRFRIKKEEGAYVERIIGTIQARASQEPGASGNDPKKRRCQYDQANDAQMTLQEAEKWLAREIAQRYHIKRHSSLGMSPGQAWIAAHTTPRGLVLPPVITDVRSLLISFLPIQMRKLNHDGIHLFGGRYYSHELAPFVGRDGKVEVCYDPRNMARIYVDVGDGIFVDVCYADMTKPALPLFEIKSIRRELKLKYPEQFDAEARRQFQRDKNSDRQASAQTTKEKRHEERLLQAKNSATNDSVAGSTPSSSVAVPRVEELDRADYSAPAIVSMEGDV
jgi:putative transposase